MKSFLISIWYLFFSVAADVENARTSDKGIDFFKGTLTEALAKAKTENKPIFIDVYASWCGPCKQLKRTTFKDGGVGAYFNKNFISISIDGETEEGRKVMANYAVTSYPTLLVVDAKGKLLTRATGYLKPYILINFGRRIVP